VGLRGVFGRYNITSERDLEDAVERTSQYVAERGATRRRFARSHVNPDRRIFTSGEGGI
jgi:hypothetical protein